MSNSTVFATVHDITLATSDETTDIPKYPFIEIPLLILVILIGVAGNIFIIGAALFERQLRNMGVYFIINLAVADLMVTIWFVPVVLTNVLNDYSNVLEDVYWLCQITGFVVAWCCQVSMLSLMFIALSRYWKLTHLGSFQKYFGKKPSIFIILAIWIECFLVSLPLIVGWFGSDSVIKYNEELVSCMWDDKLPVGFNVFLVVVSIFIPLIVTACIYVAIFMHIRKTKPHQRDSRSSTGRSDSVSASDKTRIKVNGRSDLSSCTDDHSTGGHVRTHHARHNSIESYKSAHTKRAEERERHLISSVVVVLAFFLLFWTPYGVIILIHTEVGPFVRRACGWLAVSNSAVNSIIYGALNRNFRRGYVTFCRKICCCDRIEPLFRHISKSTKQPERRTSSKSYQQEYIQHSVKFGKP